MARIQPESKFAQAARARVRLHDAPQVVLIGAGAGMDKRAIAPCQADIRQSHAAKSSWLLEMDAPV